MWHRADPDGVPGMSERRRTADRLAGGAIARVLEESRAGVRRVEVAELAQEVRAGALVVDTRPVEQRVRDGLMPGAVVIDRNVLEWRLDPSSPHRIPQAPRPGQRVVVVVCDEGYSSSLAAATLRRLGVTGATDLVGGFQAWLEAGHVPEREPFDRQHHP